MLATAARYKAAAVVSWRSTCHERPCLYFSTKSTYSVWDVGSGVLEGIPKAGIRRGGTATTPTNSPTKAFAFVFGSSSYVLNRKLHAMNGISANDIPLSLQAQDCSVKACSE